MFIFSECLPLIWLSLVTLCAGRRLYQVPGKGVKDDASKQPIQTSRPYNIAHRGSNGEIPEETKAAYLVLPFESFLVCFIWLFGTLCLSNFMSFFLESNWRGDRLYRNWYLIIKRWCAYLFPWCYPWLNNRCCESQGVCWS